MSAMTAAMTFLMSNTPGSLAFVFRNKILHYNAVTAFSSKPSYFQAQLYYTLPNCIRLFYSHEIQRWIVWAFFIHFLKQ